MVAKRKTSKMLQRFVFSDKTDYRGATPQEFFLYMQKIVGRWWINDFRTPGEDIDATILELNMEKLKDNVM